MRFRAWGVPLAGVALAASCASSAPARRVVAPVFPLPRSSLAAVIVHRGKLELTDDEVKALQGIDDRREERLMQGLQSRPADAPPDSGDPDASTPGATRGGGGFGGSRGGGMRRGHGGGGGRQRSDEDRYQARIKRWDDADTAAYLEAENVLQESQRPRARDIASRFRADLSAQREKPPPAP